MEDLGIYCVLPKNKKKKEDGLFYSNSNNCCISWMINYNKFRGNSANYILKFKVAEKSAQKKLILAVLKQLSKSS
jgi:hypothetical protein